MERTKIEKTRHPNRLSLVKLLLFPAALLFNPLTAPAQMRIYENIAVSNFPSRLIPHVGKHPIHQGFLNVTQPPYNATGDGITDDSWSIQAAINDAYDSNLIVFFPGDKTYLCENDLYCTQAPWGDGGSQRKFSHKLRGSTLGGKPVLKLQDGTSLPENIFIRFSWKNDDVEDPSRHYCAEFRNIYIDMGNNPNASAIRMHGAQHCVIEDVEIYGVDFNIGLDGLPGSGGGVCNVGVTGGNIGIYQNQYRPNPTLTGVRLIGQSQRGIQTAIIRGPLVATGFQVESPEIPNPDYRAIECSTTYVAGTGTDPSVGNLVLIDGTIRVHGSSGTAIRNVDQDCYFENIYIDANTLVESGIRNTPPEITTGLPAGQWNRIRSYCFATGSDHSWMSRDNVASTATVDTVDADIEPATEPPFDTLIDRHLYSRPFPSWEKDDIIDITDFGATADDYTDDAPAIQAVLNSAKGSPAYIPRGHFMVKSPISIPGGSTLLGAGNTISVLHVDKNWLLTNTASVIETQNQPAGTVVLADFAILEHEATPSEGTESHRLLRCATINSEDTLWRNIQLSRVEYWKMDNQLVEPSVKIQGNGGGKFFNFCKNTPSQDKMADGFPSDGFHILEINSTTHPIHFYQASIENHGRGAAQVLFTNSSKIAISGFKYEHQHRLLDIIDCRHIHIYGGSGNYYLTEPDDTSIIQIQRGFDVRLACLARQQNNSVELSGKLWVDSDSTDLNDDSSIAFFSILADYDMDDLPDHWEETYATNLSTLDATQDQDNDNSNDLDEYISGTDPTNTTSYFHTTSSALTDGRLLLTWNSVSGRVYSVEGTPDLLLPFSLVTNNLFFPRNQHIENSKQTSNRFFRIIVQQP